MITSKQKAVWLTKNYHSGLKDKDQRLNNENSVIYTLKNANPVSACISQATHDDNFTFRQTNRGACRVQFTVLLATSQKDGHYFERNYSKSESISPAFPFSMTDLPNLGVEHDYQL